MKKYKLKKIKDFLQIPKDRRAVAVQEMIPAFDQLEEYVDQMKKGLPKWLHWVIGFNLRSMTWIDDGKQDVTIRVNGKAVEK